MLLRVGFCRNMVWNPRKIGRVNLGNLKCRFHCYNNHLGSKFLRQKLMYESKLRQAIAEALEVAPEVLAPDASSDTIEAWDSLKHLDVILNIERSYNVKFKTSEIAELVSVARIEDALRQHNAL
ncbi:hypothetical protein F7734_05875 [Scytonema sp. UIC 10036]|nr:hypothetical protein [Scytonema sp. UIC 10036]